MSLFKEQMFVNCEVWLACVETIEIRKQLIQNVQLPAQKVIINTALYCVKIILGQNGNEMFLTD